MFNATISISVFGYILIIVSLFIIIKSRSFERAFSSFFVLELIFAGARINSGYFLKIDESYIDFTEILLGVLFFLSLTMIWGNKKIVIGKNEKVSLLLIVSIVIGMLFCTLFPAQINVINFNNSWDRYLRGDISQMQPVAFTSQAILMFFRVLIFIVILNTAYKNYREWEWENIASKVIKGFRVIIGYGVLEALLKFVFQADLSPIFLWLFGAEGTNIARLQGLSREPSYYALALSNFIVISMIMYFQSADRKKKKAHIIWILIAILLGIISTSFSFLICLMAIALLWIYLHERRHKRNLLNISLGLFLIIITMIIVATSNEFISYASRSSSTLLNRVAESVNQVIKSFTGNLQIGKDFSSEAARLGGGVMSFIAAMKRPVFGLGIGTTYCTTGLICIFANIGLVGLFLWIKLLFVNYGRRLPPEFTIIILLPVLVCNDLYTLYDTFYLLIIPMASLIMRKEKRNQVYVYKKRNNIYFN